MKPKHTIGLLLVFASGVLLASCGGSEMATLGDQITKEEAVARAESFDYDVATYHATQSADIQITGTADSTSVSIGMKLEGESCFDFSDSSDYYFGYYAKSTMDINMALTYDGESLSSGFSATAAEGLQLDKGDNGTYTVSDYTYSAMTIDGETSVNAYPQAYSLALSSEAEIAVAEASFFYAAGASFEGFDLVETALEDSSTEYYLNSDGILSIKGKVSDESALSPSGVPDIAISYEFVVQYDEHGLLTYYEASSYTTSTASYSVSGSIKMVGKIGGSVEHKKFADIVKESQPEDTSSSLTA
ncbi:MAG: hypothetical protein Q4F15_04500 [Bacillota bacterium]|nr:hypothetical protein [Bacillota bacterium]